MSILLWISLLGGISTMVVLALTVRRAQLGYEDEGGFHFGREPLLESPDHGRQVVSVVAGLR